VYSLKKEAREGGIGHAKCISTEREPCRNKRDVIDKWGGKNAELTNIFSKRYGWPQ